MNRRDGGECLNRKAVNEPEFLSDILRAKSIKIFGINSSQNWKIKSNIMTAKVYLHDAKPVEKNFYWLSLLQDSVVDIGTALQMKAGLLLLKVEAN